MSLSDIALCARALVRLGAKPISSFDDGSIEAEIAQSIYTPTRDALLSAYPWSFATQQTELNTLLASPLADYQNAFQLPNDFLRVMSAGTGQNSQGISYRIYQRALHTDFDNIVLTYVFRPAEADCPAFFDQALIAQLAAELCLPITESTSRAQLLFQLAENEMKRAKQIDAQQDTPNAISDFTLIDVRN